MSIKQIDIPIKPLPKHKRYTYISLFSSAGVGCYAFKKAGFDCVATNELLEKRLVIQKYNKKCKYDTGYIAGDISLAENKNKIFAEIDKWKLTENIDNIDMVIATPPCQGMSVANHKKKNEENRNSLILESIYLIDKIEPKYFVFENVRLFLKTACINSDGEKSTIGEAINSLLGGKYNILAKVINFKNYGANSSRTRTLVIGVRKNIKDITPYDLFPSTEPEKNLRTVIGKHPALTCMGEISSNDIYHAFRSYDKRMLPWIEQTKEGMSAFDNLKPEYRPHSIRNGNVITNVNKNGDKYRRCEWNKVMPCIHTRNDILASQSTIHPTDNRVFSIRELMDLMNIPRDFNWLPEPLNRLNKMSLKKKQLLLKQEDINIRQSIGESVPTIIFSKIANNILNSEKTNLTFKQIVQVISQSELKNTENLYNFVKNNPLKLDVNNLSKIIEVANTNQKQTAAFYTPKNIIFDIVRKLPDINKSVLQVLEPSVGIGNFIPILCEYYKDKQIVLDVIDIDNNVLQLLKVLLSKMKYKNLTVNYINADFLLLSNNKRYDIVIGNPPFGKVKAPELLKEYRNMANNKKNTNIFSFFVEKSLSVGEHIALITPKSLLSAPEYNLTRELIETTCIINHIIDFGEKAFQGVKIETIALVLKKQKPSKDYPISVESYITNKIMHIVKDDVFDKDFKYWLIYINDFFKQTKQKFCFAIFDFYRDRSITKKHTLPAGKYRVLKSRNIGNNQVVSIKGYDAYINDINPFQVKKFLDSNTLLVPNLSYNPRACFMPKQAITDGSVAILQAKNVNITDKDVKFFASQEFQQFYMIGRNLGSRSLNIDSNSIKLWGVRKKNYVPV
ncbi:MAG: DNA cytosine methyltransferase [Bacteroidales bacterium]|jgi:DNA (cytosine-5)-methyltransferase 1|nr:DNA cytosine methyltransferase [Bacteroidales bacterium]